MMTRTEAAAALAEKFGLVPTRDGTLKATRPFLLTAESDAWPLLNAWFFGPLHRETINFLVPGDTLIGPVLS